MQQNMDIIDGKKDISTDDEAPRGSYQKMEGLWRSRRPKQPSVKYIYGKQISMLVDYTQISLKKVLKLFKEKGLQELHKEINQLDYRDVIEPTSPEDMTKEDKNRALQYLILLKQK